MYAALSPSKMTVSDDGIDETVEDGMDESVDEDAREPSDPSAVDPEYLDAGETTVALRCKLDARTKSTATESVSFEARLSTGGAAAPSGIFGGGHFLI